MKSTRKQYLYRSAVLALLVCAPVMLWLSCGGESPSSSTSTTDTSTTVVVPLSTSDVTTVVQNAVMAVNAPMAVAVVDRAGNVLAVFDTPGEPATATAIGNFGNTVSANDLAVSEARTAAYFSNDQAPLSTRTVRYISGIHFPPGVAGTPNADLYGIENTNRGCTLSNNFLPGQTLNPSLSLEGTPGLGIATGKADVYDSQPFAVNPGGFPLFNQDFHVVGGVGVVSTTSTGALNNPVVEYAAFMAAFPGGVIPTLPPPGVVIVGGIALPFVTQTTPPPGTSAGTAPPANTIPVTCGLGGPQMCGTVPPEEWLVGPNASTANVAGALAASDVNEIVMNAVATANITRAVIRLPLNQSTKMTIAVSDLNGTLLGLYRMHDGTVFSTDVAASKARNVIWFSTVGVPDLPGVPMGTAVTNRTISFGAQPLFPPGIDGSGPGPFFPLYQYDTANPCTQGPSSQANPPNTNMSGVVFFPGSLPLYRNGVLVGGLGVSGDGVDQDDFVTAGAVDAACGFGGPCGVPNFQAPVNIQADQVVIDNVRLPYQKFPRNPTL
jgi:uncharacterized protein GlcG (DUF336 family)